MIEKLFLIDGMALIYRAYYAMVKNPLTSSKGINTSVLYGFINSLLKLLKDENPKYIAIVLDTKAKTFRHKEYDLYKANRKPMPDDLSEQLSTLYQVLKVLNIQIFKKDGYEADDLIGTIPNLISSDNISIYMYSSDKDLVQLVNKKTFLYSPGNSFKPTTVYNIDNVFDKYGIYPNNFIDYLALVGDTSDNIPGVKGVGAKTASKLLKEFSTLENIYKGIEKIDNPRIKKILLENKDNAFLSKSLATIDRNVEIEIDIQKMKTKNLSMDKMIKELHDYDIHTFDKFLNIKSEINENKVKINKTYHLVDTFESLDSLVAKLKDQRMISIDLETTSLDPNLARIVGISISFKKNTGFYIPFLCNDKSIDSFNPKDVLLLMKPILEISDIKFIGQNIKYDALILKRNGIDINNIFFDTMIAESLISPEKNSYKLDNLSKDYLNYNMVPIEDLIGDKSNQISMDKVPLKDICFYACEDADVVFQLYEIQSKILKDKNLEGLFYDVEIPLIKVLMDIEYNGVYVDKSIINSLRENLESELDSLKSKIHEISKKEFNINSPKQLSEVLFDDLKLKMFKKRSTSHDVLKKLVDHHPIADFLLNYRHLNKLVNTYLDKLPAFINPNTNRIHTSFNQGVTSTGRLSSTKPNFQNIPIKSDVGKSIRKAFKASAGNYIISFDYSQIELRILAHYSKEKKLIDSFKNNLDIHSKTASLIYGINIDEVKYNHRRVAKIINYSIAYGAGPFRISQELKITIKEASNIISNYFDRYPGIRRYIDNTIKEGLENGFVSTILGRQRNTYNLRSTNRNLQEAEKRATINMPIQGTAAELIKVAMIQINNKLKEMKLKSKMILQIHDELLFETPKNEKENIIKMVVGEMENAINLDVPIKVDYNFGDNWYEAH
jgi:DNA polymerase-1